MKNLLLMLVLVAFIVSGCATIDYFKQPENQKILAEAGVTCFEGQDYTIGIEYGLTREGQEITNATQVGGIIGCGNKKFSVICDVTKKPDENPCSNMKSYTEDQPLSTPKLVPKMPPRPVIEIKPEEKPIVEPVVENPVS